MKTLIAALILSSSLAANAADPSLLLQGKVVCAAKHPGGKLVNKIEILLDGRFGKSTGYMTLDGIPYGALQLNYSTKLSQMVTHPPGTLAPLNLEFSVLYDLKFAPGAKVPAGTVLTIRTPYNSSHVPAFQYAKLRLVAAPASSILGLLPIDKVLYGEYFCATDLAPVR